MGVHRVTLAESHQIAHQNMLQTKESYYGMPLPFDRDQSPMIPTQGLSGKHFPLERVLNS
jgi:hypothetical protein